jgi:hypothetical protein
MMTLEANRAGELDASARDLIATFVAHVMTIAHYDQRSVAMAGPINVLLLAALSGGESAPVAWSKLYRMTSEIVSRRTRAREARSAYAFLQSFVRENQDLAND